ncbi:MAG: AAA+ family ATPase [Firmicutes bacterium HGW-Firmicutes-9]|nr:MAG: AAA+ family ATPase [Firmicutes bacterium HGW-Firmicutes-9]
MNDLTTINLQLNSLTVYRTLLQDETVARFARVLSAAQSGSFALFLESYGAFLQQLSMESGSFYFAAHMEQLIRFDDNAFTRAAAQGGRSEGYIALRNAASFDLEALRAVASISFKELSTRVLSSANEQESSLVSRMPEYIAGSSRLFDGSQDVISTMETFYRMNGYGVFAKFGAFRWDHALLGIPQPDPIRLSDLKSYEYERGLVAANTKDFVEGRGGGNMLLYGDRGTGKSSTIKALANEYCSNGLRIVEVTKDAIPQFPAIMERLREVPLRFILFLDDLSFSTDDAAFSALKSVLEGGVVVRPENCRIYATSNRRHLVKETFSERSVDLDDVHAGDTKQEKLSLYDRFDQTVNFFAPDQAQFLAIVRAIAHEKVLQVSFEELDRGAIQWAIRAGGRSPRAAKQFVEWAAAQLQKGASILEE